jgi:hypothetical protein
MNMSFHPPISEIGLRAGPYCRRSYRRYARVTNKDQFAGLRLRARATSGKIMSGKIMRGSAANRLVRAGVAELMRAVDEEMRDDTVKLVAGC